MENGWWILGWPGAVRGIAFDLLDSVGEGGKDDREVLSHGPGATGEVHDERLFTDTGDRA